MEIPRHTGDRRTAQAYVRDSIRSAIFAGQIQAGERLVQADIAKQLDVSTTPVREALRELATEGLLRLDAHHGAVVRDLDPAELQEIHDLRRLLEPEVMRRAVPRLTAEQFDEAAALQQAMAEETTVAQWAELNRRFHRIFHEASGSTRLSETVSNLQDRYAAYIVSSTVRDPQRRAQSDKEHWAILEAARHADVHAAVEHILEHIQAPLERMQERA